MVDNRYNHYKDHHHATGTMGGYQDMGRPKMYSAINTYGMLIRVTVTTGTTTDCTQDIALIYGIIDKAIESGYEVVIHPNKNCKA